MHGLIPCVCPHLDREVPPLKHTAYSVVELHDRLVVLAYNFQQLTSRGEGDLITAEIVLVDQRESA